MQIAGSSGYGEWVNSRVLQLGLANGCDDNNSDNKVRMRGKLVVLVVVLNGHTGGGNSGWRL